MTTGKPMSDGGKGSVRRNEDTEAYRNNFDNIFRKKEQTMKNYEEDDLQQSEDMERSDEGEWSCDHCGGPMYRQAHWNYAQCDDCGARQELIDDDYL
jgi:ribosomal protein L37AE/L43A